MVFHLRGRHWIYKDICEVRRKGWRSIVRNLLSSRWPLYWFRVSLHCPYNTVTAVQAEYAETEDMVTVMVANEVFNPERPDTFRENE